MQCIEKCGDVDGMVVVGNVGVCDTVGKCVYGATVVIGSKDVVFFFVVIKGREAVLSLGVSFVD